MIGVDKIEDIRKRARGGESIASIARAVGASEPTVGKYARMEDLSPEPPRRREHESEVLAPYEETVDSRLDDDCRNWRKQRHTATRVYVRLRDEEGYTGGYSTVQRYVRRRREETARERDRRDAEGFLTLRWLPGEVQVDFGEADFRARGVVTRGKYLTVTFPHSNVGLTRVLWGETAECVCQGLRDVFEFVGGVPRRAVFDNATEVGGRVGGEVRTSELFRRFAAHYGLDYTFTNPYSGNEKGNVENKVGCHRRNLFVPVPSFRGLATLMWTVPGGALETGGPYMRDPRHPRHFTDEFKRQIVDLYNAGKPKREIMDEYDLGKSTVERRVKSINATGSPRAADNRTPEQNRILELERENRRLRMEVDVLKQAALIYARK